MSTKCAFCNNGEAYELYVQGLLDDIGMEIFKKTGVIDNDHFTPTLAEWICKSCYEREKVRESKRQ